MTFNLPIFVTLKKENTSNGRVRLDLSILNHSLPSYLNVKPCFTRCSPLKTIGKLKKRLQDYVEVFCRSF